MAGRATTINRTNVELKLGQYTGKQAQTDYQSYQCGIEMFFEFHGRVFWILSIVPMWN